MTVTDAAPGTTCLFHADCCEPDDFTCPGNCHKPASRAIQLLADKPAVPMCTKHFRMAMSAYSTVN